MRFVAVRFIGMVNRPKGRNAGALREACRAVGLEPSWHEEGKRLWLSSDVMEELEARLLCFKEAEREHSCELQERPPAPDAIHMFWEDPKALLAGDERPRDLQPQDMLGLWSCLAVGMTVFLWSFSKVNVFRHSRLHLGDASELLARGEAVGWLRRGLRVQHLSDYIRCLAVKQHEIRLGVGSWVGDLDAIWIRPCRVCPSRSGHIFASMTARWNTIRGTAGDIRHWREHFVRKPNERVHLCNAPAAFPVNSPVLTEYLVDMRELFSCTPDLSKLNYTAIVKLLLGRIRASGLALDVADPIVYHPIPHFARPVHVFGVGGATDVHGTPVPEPDVVLQHSCVLAQTFFSWGGKAFEDARVRPDSLYSKLFAAVGLPSMDGSPIREIALDFFPIEHRSIRILKIKDIYNIRKTVQDKKPKQTYVFLAQKNQSESTGLDRGGGLHRGHGLDRVCGAPAESAFGARALQTRFAG